MSRYIDADAVVEHIEELQKLNSKDDCFCGNLQAFKSIINFQPTADVQPIAKGQWEPHPNSREWDVCSVCGIGTKRREYGYQEDYGREWMMEENYRYCPHCGADLKKESR